VTTVISQFPDAISLQCNFANSVDLETSFTADESDLDQTASDEEEVSFTDGFTVELENTSGDDESEFTVGEPISAIVNIFTRFFSTEYFLHGKWCTKVLIVRGYFLHQFFYIKIFAFFTPNFEI